MEIVRSAWIVSVGTELTLGQTVDTNSAWLSARLAARGIRVLRHATVSDDLEQIVAVLREALGSADLVLITGGLGPTADDLTREALAQVAGVPLERHEPSVEHLTNWFAARNRAVPPANLVQARLPRDAEALDNTCGTAPGIGLRIRQCGCFALPGVPHEMREMFVRSVEPRLSGSGRVLVSRKLNCFGLGESEIGARIADLMTRGRNPDVGTTAQLGEVGVRINAAGDDPAAASALADADEAEIRRRLGVVIYASGEESLAMAVGELLAARGLTVSTAESCTGGMLGAELTSAAGSSRYYLGGAVAYANAVKESVLGVESALLRQYGAVSEPVAAAMARGARNRFGSDYALSTTGVAGPAGGTPEKPVGLVYIGLAGPQAVSVRELRFGPDSSREIIRVRATRSALDLLRRHLLG